MTDSEFWGFSVSGNNNNNNKLFGKRKRNYNTPQNIFPQFEKVVTIKYLLSRRIGVSYSG